MPEMELPREEVMALYASGFERLAAALSGLSESDLDVSIAPGEWTVRQIVHQRSQDEIRTQYVYFGSTSRQDVHRTQEGELCWVRLDDATDLNVSATTRFTLEHYLRVGSRTDCIYVGTVDALDGKPAIRWAVLRDWEAQPARSEWK